MFFGNFWGASAFALRAMRLRGFGFCPSGNAPSLPRYCPEGNTRGRACLFALQIRQAGAAMFTRGAASMRRAIIGSLPAAIGRLPSAVCGEISVQCSELRDRSSGHEFRRRLTAGRRFRGSRMRSFAGNPQSVLPMTGSRHLIIYFARLPWYD